jgi:hypothetical protein
MHPQDAAPPVRFRAIIEMSFPDADPWDPADYGELIEQWRKSLENSTLFNCKDVLIRQITAIGDGGEDDYQDWRFRKGRYDISSHGTGGIKGISYPVPAVSPADLAAVWNSINEQQGDRIAISVEQTCQPGADIEAVAARTLFLRVLREKYLFPDWQDDEKMAARVYEQAATFPIERPPTEIDAGLFIRSLKARWRE